MKVEGTVMTFIDVSGYAFWKEVHWTKDILDIRVKMMLHRTISNDDF